MTHNGVRKPVNGTSTGKADVLVIANFVCDLNGDDVRDCIMQPLIRIGVVSGVPGRTDPGLPKDRIQVSQFSGYGLVLNSTIAGGRVDLI